MPDPFALTPITGAPLAPSQVVGRDDQILDLGRRLAEGNNVLISDPRRIGKTAMLDRFCNSPPNAMLAVKVDYQAVKTSEQLLKQTIAALRSQKSVWHKCKAAVERFAERIELGVEAEGVILKGAYRSGDPRRTLAELVARVDERLGDDILVLALDEATIAVDQVIKNEGTQSAAGLLHELQALRKRSDSSLRWVLAGSVGFHHILPRAGATEHVIGDLLPVTVGPLNPDKAIFLFQCLMLGIERTCSDQTAAHAAAATDGLPFLIQHVAHQLRESGDGGDVSQTDVEAALSRFIDDPDHSRALTHLVSRIEDYYSNSAGAARALLDVAAANDARGQPTTQSELEAAAGGAGLEREEFLKLLNDLRADHYLVPAPQATERAWVWRYPVLARIWRDRRHIT